MLSAECRTPGLYGELYGDALITALVVEIARLDGAPTDVARRHSLSPRHLRLVVDYMQAQVGGAGVQGSTEWAIATAGDAVESGMAPQPWAAAPLSRSAR